LKPRFETKTILLWGAPLLLAVAGGLSLIVFARRRVQVPTGSRLSEEEEKKLGRLMHGDGL
jgi:cytochrome c-type biogenesis protein CcmH